MTDDERIAISFIVDRDPVFAYQGWHLAHSLMKHFDLSTSEIHVQFTPDVPREVIDEFRVLGCGIHQLHRFGDGRFCNKLAQWENLCGSDAEQFIFLDTDMICLENFGSWLPRQAVAGKVVDLDNPPLDLLDSIFEQVGFENRPPVVPVDSGDAMTYLGNCNGGLYSVSAQFAEQLFTAWKRHALNLIANIQSLREAGRENHVDQIAFCLAMHETKLPFCPLPSNVNYFVHFSGSHRYYDPKLPIALLHYHNQLLNVLGLLESPPGLEPHETAALSKSNCQIREHFNNRLFWDFRYARFPERGSGVGSRGDNLEYKRSLLRAEGVEQAESVLDVGCGDLQVLGTLELKNYVGIDRSLESLAIAARVRPGWTFMRAPAADAPSSEYVLCFEVAIHQETRQAYDQLVDFLAQKTKRTLIVSGYDSAPEEIAGNHMLFFHEPLRKSLEGTERFASIQRIGAHSDVVVYRCDVEPLAAKSATSASRNNTVIFVLGMHRSGTSAITRVLALCEALLPTDLMGAYESNPRGHWEPLEALKLNEEFLSQQGSSWDDPTLHLEHKYIQLHDRALFIAKIRRFLLRSAGEKPLVIKEPRITVLADYWFEAAQAAGMEVKVVVSVRHPNEIIASLVARDKISVELASTLYTKYSLLAERNSRNYARVFVGYENLLHNWRQEMTRVSKLLFLEMRDRNETEIDQFLSPELHRQRDSRTPEDWIFGNTWMSNIHEVLLTAAEGSECDHETLDEIYNSFSSLEFTFRRSVDEFRSRNK